MLKLWPFWFQLFLPFPGLEVPAQNLFRHFRPEFWLGTSGYLCQAGDSSHHDFLGGAHLWNGSGVFLTHGRRLGAGDFGVSILWV
jgi:hypothetical protein